MSKPRVSIILPTFNGAQYIAQSITSCLEQSFTDFELIIVDDGSIDSTMNVVRAYTDPRIHILRHEINRKLPRALNTGLEMSQGEYLTWIADDDLFAKDAVQCMVNFLDQNPKTDAVYSDYCLIDEDGASIRLISLNSLAEIRHKSVSSPCFMYRRKVYQALGGYNPEVFMIEDYEFWLRVWQKFTISYLPAVHPLYLLRERSGSLTGKYRWRVHRMAVDLRQKLFNLSWAEVQQQISEIEVHQAFENYRSGDRKQTIQMACQALLRNPGWIRNKGLLSILFHSITSKQKTA